MARILSVVLVLWSTTSAFSDPDTIVTLPGGATMQFVWIEPGTFTMGTIEDQRLVLDRAVENELVRTGSDERRPHTGWDDNERPAHDVIISRGYYLAKHEITQAQWQSVMGTTPWVGQSYAQASPTNAASYLSWNDVQVFVHALNEAVGDSVYRLPTEAEWEYACRAGSTTLWFFGNDDRLLESYAWYNANAWWRLAAHAQPVCTKHPNPWGFCDMYGNVSEWVLDKVGDYTSTAQVDPAGVEKEDGCRIIRGGAFDEDLWDARSATRAYHTTGGRTFSVGARLVKMGRAPASTVVLPSPWGHIKNDTPTTPVASKARGR